MAILFRDILPRLRIEQALRESEERFRTLFEGIGEGFFLCERVSGEPVNYRYLTANPAFERQTGFRDPVGRTMRELVPTIEDAIMERYRRVEETGHAETFTSHVAALDRWFEIEATPADRPGRIAVLFRDITDRKKIEAALRASEERQAFLLKLSDALRHVADPLRTEGVAARVLAEHLDVDRAYYVEVDEDAGIARVGSDYLLAAGQIVSVEARHAAALRDLAYPLSAAFAGDDVVNLLGLDLARSPSEVAPLVQPYIAAPLVAVQV